ncbi:MAG: U32 family peptidase [Muribaculaceae bacterium]|nr:U32 family peptidase [Muribaculaceae bacterium]
MARRIELLSPARDVNIAREAILHGADAVYIGAPKFSARVAAGNSIEEIASLVEFAHIYGAKIYVALNTIIKDEEITEVESLIKSLYEIGVDALIVQDMGITKMNIPPIQLHASTQCHNASVEQVKFLEESGFEQVVLARELNVNQITEICKKTSVPIEVFIHGALCVSYSGRCYLSQALAKRSANRGECAQFCRLPYNLEDSEGNILIKDKHLLSLKDMNRSDSIEALLDAGVTSFKIEGRLKDVEYVKNVTAYYRFILDEIFSRRSEYTSASSGKVKVKFTPNPYKSFNRGFTPYYTNSEEFKNIASVNTPKSIGEKVGVVKSVQANFIEVDSDVELHNGDGLCFTSKEGEFSGFGINTVEGNKLFPSSMPNIKRGDVIYRNSDIKFSKLLASPTAERKIATSIKLAYEEQSLLLQITDDKNNEVIIKEIVGELDNAKTNQKNNQETQLSKLGNTPFEASDIDVSQTENLFIPSSLLTNMRRSAIEELIKLRIKNHTRPQKGEDLKPTYPQTELNFDANVSNAKAVEFYKEHGVEKISQAYELKPIDDAHLMTTIHCIRRSFGKCLKTKEGATWKEPLYLVSDKSKLQLHFNCKECKMIITK